jgi:hypothetical protein
MNPLLNPQSIQELQEQERERQREELRKQRTAPNSLRKDGTNKFTDRPLIGRRRKLYTCALCGHEWEDEALPNGRFPKPSGRCRNQKTCHSTRWQDGKAFIHGPQPRPGRQGIPLKSVL